MNVQDVVNISNPLLGEISGKGPYVLGITALIVLGIGFRNKFGGLVKGSRGAVRRFMGKLKKR